MGHKHHSKTGNNRQHRIMPATGDLYVPVYAHNMHMISHNHLTKNPPPPGRTHCEIIDQFLLHQVCLQCSWCHCWDLTLFRKSRSWGRAMYGFFPPLLAMQTGTITVECEKQKAHTWHQKIVSEPDIPIGQQQYCIPSVRLIVFLDVILQVFWPKAIRYSCILQSHLSVTSVFPRHPVKKMGMTVKWGLLVAMQITNVTIILLQ